MAGGVSVVVAPGDEPSLVTELSAADDEEEVSWRDGKRFVARLAPVEVARVDGEMAGVERRSDLAQCAFLAAAGQTLEKDDGAAVVEYLRLLQLHQALAQL